MAGPFSYNCEFISDLTWLNGSIICGQFILIFFIAQSIIILMSPFYFFVNSDWTMPDNQKYGSSDSINFDVTYKIRH